MPIKKRLWFYRFINNQCTSIKYFIVKLKKTQISQTVYFYHLQIHILKTEFPSPVPKHRDLVVFISRF